MLCGVIPTISTSRLCPLRRSGKVALRTRSCAWISLKAPPQRVARSSSRRVRALGAKAAERKPHVTRERTQLSARSGTGWWQRMRVWIQQPRPRGPRPHDETDLISALQCDTPCARRTFEMMQCSLRALVLRGSPLASCKDINTRAITRAPWSCAVPQPSIKFKREALRLRAHLSWNSLLSVKGNVTTLWMPACVWLPGKPRPYVVRGGRVPDGRLHLLCLCQRRMFTVERTRASVFRRK